MAQLGERNVTNSAARLLFYATCFASAFLLFQVQPLISKFITPWFGGGPSVWTSGLLFFQLLLFAGYAYTYLAERFLTPRGVVILHGALLVAAVATLPIHPDPSRRPMGGVEPQGQVLLTLLTAVGLPYFMLATTAPLIQVWFSRVLPARSPYRLYALSNAGSLLALLSYPTAVEPFLGLSDQAHVWSLAFVLFSLACIGCALLAAAKERRGAAPTCQAEKAITGGQLALWLSFSFCGSTLLLTITNHLCQEVASLPLLWVAPLALYLVTFILCFESDRWYRRAWWMGGMLVCSLAAGFLWGSSTPRSLIVHSSVSLPLLFTCCMVCHGELARIKPPVSGLTTFYLCVAGGGVLGGVFVNLGAPAIFTHFLELPLAVILCWSLALAVVLKAPNSLLNRGPWSFWAKVAVLVVAANFAVWLPGRYTFNRSPTLYRGRNFYGVVEVLDTNPRSREHRARMLRNGRITHGAQYVNGPRHKLPLHYFGVESGVGKVLDRRGPARRVGVVGLGIGTVAAYGAAGDTYRFYEINPLVIAAAQEWFTYLRGSEARVEVVEGDARLLLEQELAANGPQRFDVLVLDAFSGDAIPVHLLTREAFELYDRHLASDGVLVVHISNRHFKLDPIVFAAVSELGYFTSVVETTTSANDERLSSVWVVASRRQSYFAQTGIAAPVPPHAPDRMQPWTDDFSSLWGSLRY